MGVEVRSPDESIDGLGGRTIGDFWAWAFSDLLNNLHRSKLAEYIVGSALDCVSEPRVEWDSYDLECNGIKIEVKCSAFIQTWNSKRISKISFDIAKKYRYGESGMENQPNPPYRIRPSDCYVFCLYAQRDRSKVDVLNIPDWRFYIMGTDRLNETFGDQKTVSLSVLERYVDPVPYEGIWDKLFMEMDG